MAGHQSREANLARLKALADDPMPKNINNLIDLIENLWIGEGFSRETDSDGTTIEMNLIDTENNFPIIRALLNSKFVEKFFTVIKPQLQFFELKIPKEAMK